jgi:hypothetical protein
MEKKPQAVPIGRKNRRAFRLLVTKNRQEALRQLAIANKRVVTTKPYRNGGIVNHLNLYHRER